MLNAGERTSKHAEPCLCHRCRRYFRAAIDCVPAWKDASKLPGCISPHQALTYLSRDLIPAPSYPLFFTTETSERSLSSSLSSGRACQPLSSLKSTLRCPPRSPSPEIISMSTRMSSSKLGSLNWQEVLMRSRKTGRDLSKISNQMTS